MTINDQHKIDSKIIFRDKENQNLIDLLLQELSRNRMAWNMLRRMSKVTYYLRRQDDFFLKVKYYLRKVFRKDTLNYRGIDTFSVAYQRKSLDYLKWRIEKNNNLENLKTIEEILQTKSYKGIVVYPTTIPWEPLQRPQQLMRELAKLGYLCFYCDNYRQRLEITQIETNLYIVSGEQYLIYPLKQRPVIVLCTWMMNLPFVNMLNDYFLWYDIIDRLEIFSLYDEDMRRKHQQVVQVADIITYSAQKLKEETENRVDAIYLPNGVDVADFNRQESAIKNDALLTLIKTIKDKRRPLIGYFGAIADWVDIKMIRSIAVTRKDWEFVFIGRVWTEIKEISNLPNVHLPGLISYSNLHLYAKEFDVAIVPFIVNELTDSVSPIKFFEYAALGLPIIATPFFEIKQYADNSFVRLAEDEQSMISAIEDLLEHKDMKMSQAAQEFAWANHWRERAEVIDQQINDAHYKI